MSSSRTGPLPVPGARNPPTGCGRFLLRGGLLPSCFDVLQVWPEHFCPLPVNSELDGWGQCAVKALQ